MKHEEAAVLLAIGVTAAVALIAWAMLYKKFLEDEAAWIEAYGHSPQVTELSPYDIQQLHDEVRRITREER